MSHLKNFALSASRGSMAVFIFGVVAALVGAMMLFAPAGYAQEETEAEVAETSLDQEEPAQAGEAEEEPVLYQDPISVERDDDIDTVTVDDLDFGAWRDNFSGEEKVSDDDLYGISRKSDAGIDEIVEVEADGDVVDEDAYGFIHDDEADVDKIVIDYYGLKTTPPETLTLKVKSSEEGEYSILDADDIPAKADVQDAGFLPDPSAEEQEKIDKVKKESRAADSDTHQLTLGEVSVKSDASTKAKLSAEIAGDLVRETTYLNKVVIRDNRENLSRGLNESAITFLKNGSKTELCKFNNPSTDPAVKVVDYSENGKANQVEIDLSGCTKGDSNTKKKFVDFYEGDGDTIDIEFGAAPYSNSEDFDVYFWGSRNLGEDAGKVAYPKGVPAPNSWNDGDLETKTAAVEGSKNDYHVTMTRTFEKGGVLAGDVVARVEHINGAFLDNGVLEPSVKVKDADGKVLKEVKGKAGQDPAVGVEQDLANNEKGGVSFGDLAGVNIPNGGSIVVEMGFRMNADAEIDKIEDLQPQGPGELDAELKRSDSSFKLITGDADDAMKATSYAESRGELRDGVSTYEDIVTIDKRSKFEEATVTVKADPKFLFPGFAENYTFETFYAGGQPDGKTGIEDGYKFYVKDYNVDRHAGVVTYTVGVKNEKGEAVESALIEGGTQLSVKSKFASAPDSPKTTVELVGKETKAADKTWSNGKGAVLPDHPPYAPNANFWSAGHQNIISPNSNIGPFQLEERVEGKLNLVMAGGMCLNPALDPPSQAGDPGPEGWQILPSNENPNTKERISPANQQAISYIVNRAAVRMSDLNGEKAADRFESNISALAKEIWPNKSWPNKGYTFEALYTTVLKLVGFSDSEIVKNPQPEQNDVLRTADEGVKNILAMDLSDEPVNYYIVKRIGSDAIQPVIIPGPEDGEDQRSSMATTASFEENRFDSDRLNTAVLGERSKVYDKVEFLGLNTDGSYQLHTELYAVDETGETVGEPVHTESVELSQEEIKSGEKTVEVDLNNMSSSKKAQPGRYVFFEKITDSNDDDQEIVKHANSKDAAQTFELTKSEKPNGAKLTITKVAADGGDGKDYTPVEGAKFEIHQNGKKIKDMAGNGSEFTADGLELDKIYTLVEVQAPDRQDGKNYQLLPEPLDFKFDSKEGLQFKTARGTFDNTQSFPVVDLHSNVDAGVVMGTATVANVWIGDLPKTGGNGIAPWLLLGGVIMAAGALLGNRRRA